MKQPKPIFIIRFPSETYSQLRENIEDFIEKTSNELPDYHVLVTFDPIFSVGDVKFELYNSKDITEIEFKQLQERILETIK